MFGRKAVLERVKETNLARAREISDEAKADGRDFTPEETEIVSGCMQKAKSAAFELRAIAGDEKMIEEINALGAPAGGSGSRSRGDGTWAKSMTTYLGRVGAKALTTSGSITVPSLSAGIQTLGDRKRSILQLIPIVPLTTGDQYAYIREITRTQNATTVAVGKRKPESVFELEKIEDRVKTIAHMTTVDRSLVRDVALLQQYLEEALRDGVYLELEEQILLGDGDTTGSRDDMVGILETSGIQGQDWTTDLFTTTRKAVTKLESVPGDLDPNGFGWVFHPEDIERLELSKDDEQFVMGDPGTPGKTLPIDRARRLLWGYPMTSSLAMTSGTGLLGDFAGSVEIREREDIEIKWFETGFVENLFGEFNHGDLADANKVKFRAEGRWGEAVKRPAAFVEIALTAGP